MPTPRVEITRRALADLLGECYGALGHLLRFSSIPRRWPDQHAAYLDLLRKVDAHRRALEESMQKIAKEKPPD